MGVFGHWWILLMAILFNLVFWGGLVVLAIWAVLRFSQRGGPADSALTILNERFARGEIDQQEYETRRAALRNG